MHERFNFDLEKQPWFQDGSLYACWGTYALYDQPLTLSQELFSLGGFMFELIFKSVGAVGSGAWAEVRVGGGELP